MALSSSCAPAPAFSFEQQAAHSEIGPIDLHALYLQQSACGYTRDMALPAYTAEKLAGRLRGISVITNLLLAASDTEIVKLGDSMHFGLIEAMSHLAADASADLEIANDRAAKKAKGALQ